MSVQEEKQNRKTKPNTSPSCQTLYYTLKNFLQKLIQNSKLISCLLHSTEIASLCICVQESVIKRSWSLGVRYNMLMKNSVKRYYDEQVPLHTALEGAN